MAKFEKMSCGHTMPVTAEYVRLREQGQSVRCPRCKRLVIPASEVQRLDPVRRLLDRGQRR